MDDVIIGADATDDAMMTTVSFIVTQLLQMRRRRRRRGRRNQEEIRRWMTEVTEIIIKLLHITMNLSRLFTSRGLYIYHVFTTREPL